MHDNDIYCIKYKQIIKVTVSPVLTTNVLFSYTEEIISVLLYVEKRKYDNHF